ncbi:MAG: hypothetical protein HWN81_05505 [Candidatus Lokiarchaeota archaeon]|nr:hypothetical protein [Candidatus Lokiarchaeota archaeon]
MGIKDFPKYVKEVLEKVNSIIIEKKFITERELEILINKLIHRHFNIILLILTYSKIEVLIK